MICVENATMLSIIFITTIGIYFMNRINTQNIINQTTYNDIPESNVKRSNDIKYMPVNVKTQQRDFIHTNWHII